MLACRYLSGAMAGTDSVMPKMKRVLLATLTRRCTTFTECCVRQLQGNMDGAITLESRVICSQLPQALPPHLQQDVSRLELSAVFIFSTPNIANGLQHTK